jgi:hypothetical protein
MWTEIRHRLVLTSEEKRVIIFVMAAFLLGVATKCCRDAHPRTPIKIENKQDVSRRVRGGASPRRE